MTCINQMRSFFVFVVLLLLFFFVKTSEAFYNNVGQIVSEYNFCVTLP